MIGRQALLMLALVAVAVPAAAAERTITAESARELRICVDPDNPPLSLNRMGAQPGIDVEIGQAIAERLDLRPRLFGSTRRTADGRSAARFSPDSASSSWDCPSTRRPKPTVRSR